MERITIIILLTAVSVFALAVSLKILSSLYYFGKRLFGGYYFHRQYYDKHGDVRVIYDGTIDKLLWSLSLKIYQASLFVIPLFLLFVHADDNGYLVMDFAPQTGAVVQVYDYENNNVVQGILVEHNTENKNVTLNIDDENIEFSGVVLGKYIEKDIALTDIPGIFIRSVICGTRYVIHQLNFFLN